MGQPVAKHLPALCRNPHLSFIIYVAHFHVLQAGLSHSPKLQCPPTSKKTKLGKDGVLFLPTPHLNTQEGGAGRDQPI